MSGDPYEYCHSHNVTYENYNQFYDKEHFNWCHVLDSGYDTILFASVGVLIACIVPRKWSAIVALLAGGLLQSLNLEVNLLSFGNSMNLWLGMQPAMLFFYIFLPPLLLEDAVRIEFFVFKKVILQVFVFAFLVVVFSTGLISAFIRLVLGNLREEFEWSWGHSLLFSSMVGITDSVSVSAALHQGGGPEHLMVLLEGESLFNDATAIVLFDVFRKYVSSGEKDGNVALGELILDVTKEICRLALGGIIVGLVTGILTRYILKLLQRQKKFMPAAEVGVTIVGSYLSYYLANGPFDVSGATAVVVYGLYGSATLYWEISPQTRELKMFRHFYDIFTLMINGVVFFFAGASAMNFFVRTAENLGKRDDWSTFYETVMFLPVIYVVIFILRYWLIYLISPILNLSSAKLSWRDVTFVCMAGLRGTVSLILVQEVVTHSSPHQSDRTNKIQAEMSLWTSGFVLMTIVINGPMIPYLLSCLRLNTPTVIQRQIKVRAERALTNYTESFIKAIRGNKDEMLRGVNWHKVREYVCDSETVEDDVPQQLSKARSRGKLLDAEKWDLLESMRAPLLAGHSSGEVRDAAASSNEGDRIKALDAQLQERNDDDDDLAFAMTSPAVKYKQETELPQGHTEQTVLAPRPEAGIQLLPEWVHCVTDEVVMVVGSKRGGSHHASVSSSLNSMGGGNSTFQEPEGPKQAVRRPRALPQGWSDQNDSEVGGSSHGALAGSTSPSDVAINMGSRGLDRCMSYNTVKTRYRGRKLTRFPSLYTWNKQLVAEARARFVTGIKHSFCERRNLGLISSRGLRVLEWACDVTIERSDEPLGIWSLMFDDVCKQLWTVILSKLAYVLRRMILGVRTAPVCFRYPWLPILNYLQSMVNRVVNDRLFLALELAIEYWLALKAYKAQISLCGAESNAQIFDAEIKKEATEVWQFIIDREIEAPERFQAIQTFRTIVAVLRQQRVYIHQLHMNGMIQERQETKMREELDLKIRILYRRGPRWKTPLASEVLRTVDFLADAPQAVFERILASGHLWLYSEGKHLAEGSLHIIISGLLRGTFVNSQGTEREFYLGHGGVLGLLTALIGGRYEGMGPIFAEKNALGRGPIILTLPPTILKYIRRKAAGGDMIYQHLQLNMFRSAALHLLEVLQEDIVEAAAGAIMNSQDGEEAPSSKPLIGDTKHKEAPTTSNLRDMMQSHLRSALLEADDMNDDVTAYEAPEPGAVVVDPSTAQNDAIKLYYDQGHKVYEDLREGLSEGDLVVAPPKGVIQYSRGMLVLQGSIIAISTSDSPTQPSAAAPGGDDDGAEGEGGCEFWAPCILPVLPGSLDATPRTFLAGANGAIIVACPEGAGGEGKQAKPGAASRA
ncbi:unnamed protein product [Ostreobium quekettii]|uniref:Cation/H+ exchanger transmembrane domain-containing protein n=1 Tax=Ostreobium quekettii TaxID=121088 RepID=A0A8S1JBC2_9CHLO|nr:unnamed protein product [Ostreobium quekettii]|eukprot:evm.model.scf_2259.1 EVM.evm.TU.scf_2259.1   scf_2259:758-22981(+)